MRRTGALGVLRLLLAQFALVLVFALVLAGSAMADALPVATGISPTSGPVNTIVTISGSGFSDATAVEVLGPGSWFSVPFTVVSDSQVTATLNVSRCSVPLYQFRVVTPAGASQAWMSFTCTVPFSITGVSPESGDIAGGTTVTIAGVGFIAIREVTIGGVQVSFVDNGNSLTVVTPAHAAGPVDIGLYSLQNGRISAAGAFTYVDPDAVPPTPDPTTPADSTSLSSLQRNAGPMVTTVSTQALTANVTTAITEGFSGVGTPIAPSAGGLRLAYAGDEPAPRGGKAAAALAATGTAVQRQRDWSIWAQVSVSDWTSTAAAGGIGGGQVNGMAGITRVLTPALLVGAVVGYEGYDYTIASAGGTLKGGGWTVGGYIGWMIRPKLRFDAAVARTGISYESQSGAARANVNAERWTISGKLTGEVEAGGFRVEPSAAAYAVLENQDPYTDSLSTAQPGRSFVAGRASGGAKVSYPISGGDGVMLTPFIGLYGDYYYTSDSTAAVTGLGSQAVLSGWSARATGGIVADFAGGKRATVGGEIGGIGSPNIISTLSGKLEVPF